LELSYGLLTRISSISLIVECSGKESTLNPIQCEKVRLKSMATHLRNPTSTLTAIRRPASAAVFLLLFTVVARAQSTFVYTNDGALRNTVSAFLVGPNGELTAIPGSPFLTAGTANGAGFFAADRVTISTSGRFLYAGNSISQDISAF